MKDNWDYSYNDIAGASAAAVTYAACCNLCANNAFCKAFTWNKITTMCYLKWSTGTGGASVSGAQTGSWAPVSIPDCSAVIMQDNWDYNGNDIAGASITQVSYAACCNLCANNVACKAFTWNKSNTMCYPKFSIGGGGASISVGQTGTWAS
ncbi:unnamed protein product [Didymodactylos carnosus]|uniref:Apple domain-containing protein n=1 Tax=Didymodactylos carnosus TaxID=1234261 RepID=A0A8S2U0S9_9BILA|nr:unnamed protein product [Didymodactylos carnosus]CAF4314866.1 unnamed protein product [Didymodactylos carnosus]